jgi:hypothetical protein
MITAIAKSSPKVTGLFFCCCLLIAGGSTARAQQERFDAGEGTTGRTGTQGVVGNPNCAPPHEIINGRDVTPLNWSCDSSGYWASRAPNIKAPSGPPHPGPAYVSGAANPCQPFGPGGYNWLANPVGTRLPPGCVRPPGPPLIASNPDVPIHTWKEMQENKRARQGDVQGVLGKGMSDATADALGQRHIEMQQDFSPAGKSTAFHAKHGQGTQTSNLGSHGFAVARAPHNGTLQASNNKPVNRNTQSAHTGANNSGARAKWQSANASGAGGSSGSPNQIHAAAQAAVANYSHYSKSTGN